MKDKKTKLRKLSLIFTALMIMNVILPSVSAVEYNPNTDAISIEKEAILPYASETENISKVLKALPDHFEFDSITWEEAKELETADEFYTCIDVLYDKIFNIIDPIIENNGLSQDDYYFDLEDMHSCTVYIMKGNDYDNILGKKEIKVNYTGDYNTQDEEYVKRIVNNFDTNIIHTHDITEEYVDDYDQLESDFINLIKERINDNSVDVIAQFGSAGGGGYGDISVIGSYVYLFKNNILYDYIYTDTYTINTVFLPSDIKDTTQDYINYALPLLREFFKENFEIDRVEKMNEEYIIEEDGWCTLKNDGSFYKVYFTEEDSWARFMIKKETKSNILKGDLDRNGVVNSNDAAIALDIYNGRKMEDNDLEIGDMDKNGMINSTDAAMILDVYNAQ